MVAMFSLSEYRYLDNGGTDRGEILHDDTHRSRTDLLPLGAVPPDPQIRNFGPKLWPYLTANISKTVSLSVTCQLKLNISSTTAF